MTLRCRLIAAIPTLLLPLACCTISDDDSNVSYSNSQFFLPGLIGFVLIPVLFQSQSALVQELRIELTDAEGNALENAVIELIMPAGLKSSYQTVLADVIDQQDKGFVPAVTVVPAGSEINFPNSDDILHHV